MIETMFLLLFGIILYFTMSSGGGYFINLVMNKIYLVLNLLWIYLFLLYILSTIYYEKLFGDIKNTILN